MKLALIPPPIWVEYYCSMTDYQMALAHLVEEGRPYTKFFRQCSLNGQFVMLDNSVIETGEAISDWDDYLHKAHLVGAKEIVVPDVYLQSKESLDKAREFLKWYQNASLRTDDLSLMLVPQGKNVDESIRCAYNLIQLAQGEGIQYTIGVPRSLVYQTKNASARIRVIDALPRKVQVHLLGQAEPLCTLARISRRYFNVRGIDTKLPFKLIRNGLRVNEILPRTENRDFELVHFLQNLKTIPMDFSEPLTEFWKDRIPKRSLRVYPPRIWGDEQHDECRHAIQCLMRVCHGHDSWTTYDILSRTPTYNNKGGFSDETCTGTRK